MNTQPHQFDICMVCALPEEARALLDVVRPYCDGEIEEHSSSRYQYSYRTTTITNKQGERLHLHISWLPRYGPQEMTLHLTHALEECQPRLAIMTGICAGDAEQVALGDLVVAERTFTYDSGKFTLDEHGGQVHLHDTQTYQLDAAILQFLGLFDDWKPLVAALPHPAAQSESSREEREVRCHLKAMASGSAVRADHPFRDVQIPVRGTAAIDMEGAAFALAASRHHHTPWLVVKGVCDYADQDKNDAYHDYAAHVSAAYALSFLQAYVTNERLPRREGASPTSQAELPRIWNIPYPRNPVFTGREALLAQLDKTLKPGEVVALSQPQVQAISGLGGIGKTQIALEYAYRHRQDYQVVLWLHADTRDALVSGYVQVAHLLNVSQKNEQDQMLVVEAVLQWLKIQTAWLLILDNADELEIVREFLPPIFGGHILLTTRAQSMGRLAKKVEVETMDVDTGALLLLRRAGLIAQETSLEAASPSDVSLAKGITQELGGLPLALDQAGAYLEETSCGLSEYQTLYRTHKTKLFQEYRGLVSDHPEPVTTTWSLSFQKIEEKSTAAAELLRLCAFLAPDAIPDEIVTKGTKDLGSSLQTIADEPLISDQAIATLQAYSFIDRQSTGKTINIHRLVQAVLRDSMPIEKARRWKHQAVVAVEAACPEGQDVTQWQAYERWLPHALACADWINQEQIFELPALHLLHEAGCYLDARARYHEAEPLLELAQSFCEQPRRAGIDPLQTADILQSLALLYVNLGKYEEAEPLFERVCDIYEQQKGAKHLETAQSLSNLAELYRVQGKFSEAEQLLQRTGAIVEQQMGPNHLKLASCLTILALLHWDQWRYTEAEQLLQRASAIVEQQVGPDHLDAAMIFNDLAMLLVNQEQYPAAEQLLLRASAIVEQQASTNYPNRAMSLNNLAELYRMQEKVTEAESTYRQALSLCEQQLRKDHPYTALCLNNQAGFYYNQGKYIQAEPLYRQALAIRERQLGTTHPDIAQSLNNLAILSLHQGKYEEAKTLLDRMRAIFEHQFQHDHLYTALPLNNIAGLYESRGKYTQAEAFYQRTFAIVEQKLGPGNLYVAIVLNNLARLFVKQGEFKRAEPLLAQVCDIYEQQLGATDPRAVMMMNTFAELYEKQGKFAQAEPLFERGLAMRDSQFPQSPLHQHLLIIREQQWGPLTDTRSRALTTWLCFIGT